ncbi:MAG TPA: hypothetical protein VF699_06770 [Caulobacteraceae bacterium]
MADAARRKGIPPLVWIVVALLALLVVIAVVQSDGSVTSPDTSVTMPVDLPNEPRMPDVTPTPSPVPSPQ